MLTPLIGFECSVLQMKGNGYLTVARLDEMGKIIMTIFVWDKSYEIGVPKIDAQHQTLVDMLNSLYAAKKTDQVHQVVEETLDRLLEYTQVHFNDEEAAMREANYPYLEKQIHEHIDMTNQVVKMRDLLQQGEEPATFELLNFMSEWLKFHISESDRKFGDYIKKRNAHL